MFIGGAISRITFIVQKTKNYIKLSQRQFSYRTLKKLSKNPISRFTNKKHPTKKFVKYKKQMHLFNQYKFNNYPRITNSLNLRAKHNNLFLTTSFLILAGYSTINILFQPLSPYFMVLFTWLITFLLLGSLIFLQNKNQDASFTFLFLVFFILFVYVIPLTSGNASKVAYVFYFIFFFTYHIYYTFNEKFFKKVKFIISNYSSNSEFIKIGLWLLTILLPFLIANNFVFLFVVYPILGNSLLAGHHFVFYSMLLLCVWVLFLSISAKNKIFKEFRYGIQKYFSREACVDFIGNRYLNTVY